MIAPAHSPITIAVIAVSLLALGAPAAAARTNNRSKPVLVVHGFAASKGTDFDCVEFNDLEAFLRTAGYRDIQTVAYYGGDMNCDRNVHGSGQSSSVRHLSSNQGGHFGGTSSHEGDGALGQHDQNTLIEHLGYHLAWNIRNRFGSQPVDIVAHSMGGLVVRYALQRVDAGHSRFPTLLNVEDVVTLGTPHGGTELASFCGGTEFRQCQQMLPNSEFLERLDANSSGRHPNPSNAPDSPTDWTIMGSDDDEKVSETSALSMSRADNGVFYADSMDYDHEDFFRDLNVGFDANLTFRSTSGVFPSAYKPAASGTGRARHGASWIDAALQRGDF